MHINGARAVGKCNYCNDHYGTVNIGVGLSTSILKLRADKDATLARRSLYVSPRVTLQVWGVHLGSFSLQLRSTGAYSGTLEQL